MQKKTKILLYYIPYSTYHCKMSPKSKMNDIKLYNLPKKKFRASYLFVIAIKCFGNPNTLDERK